MDRLFIIRPSVKESKGQDKETRIIAEVGVIPRMTLSEGALLYILGASCLPRSLIIAIVS